MTSRSLIQCLLNTPWKYILLIFYLAGESSPSTFPFSLGSYLYLVFVIYFTKSKLIARSVPVLILPEKCIILSSGYVSVTKNSNICRNYRHKSICINNTQLTTFYCYSATNSTANLSNKQLFFSKFKRGIFPQFILFPL